MQSNTMMGIHLQDRNYGIIDEDSEEFKIALQIGAINEDKSVTVFKRASTKDQKIAGSAYSDRLFQWDWQKYNNCCQKIFGNHGQNFDQRKPDQIEKFLQEYFAKPGLKLMEIKRWVNVSSGYPLWSFAWSE